MNTKNILKYLVVLELPIEEACKTMIDPMDLKVLTDEYERLLKGGEPNDFIDSILNNVRVILDPKKIKKAYRKMSKTRHPDKGGSHKEFIELTRAYKILTDPSFAHNTGESSEIKLAVILGLSVDFFTALFGTTLTVVLNVEDLKSEGSPKTVGPDDKQFELLTRKIDVRIKACSRTNDSIKIKGAGMTYMGVSGDLTFKLAVSEHQRYSLDEDGNVLFNEEIDLETLLKGGVIDVETPFGIKSLAVPVGTKPDQVLEIKNVVPQDSIGFSKRSLLITAKLKYPNKEILKAEPFWKKLGIKWDELDVNDLTPEQLEKLTEENEWALFEELS